MRSLEKAFASWARHEAERIKRRVAGWTPEQWEKFYLVNPKLRPIRPIEAGLGGEPRRGREATGAQRSASHLVDDAGT